MVPVTLRLPRGSGYSAGPVSPTAGSQFVKKSCCNNPLVQVTAFTLLRSLPWGCHFEFSGDLGGKKTHPLSNFSGEAKPRRQGFKGVQQKSREIFACDTDILGNSGGSSRHPGPNVCRKIQGKLGGNQRSREEGPGDYKHPS